MFDFILRNSTWVFLVLGTIIFLLALNALRSALYRFRNPDSTGRPEFSASWVSGYSIGEPFSIFKSTRHDLVVTIRRGKLRVRRFLFFGFPPFRFLDGWYSTSIENIKRVELFRENPLDLFSYEVAREFAATYSSNPLGVSVREGVFIEFTTKKGEIKRFALFPRHLEKFLQALGK